MGGISIEEMNSLETAFVELIDYNFFVKTEDFSVYLQKLAAYEVINEWASAFSFIVYRFTYIYINEYKIPDLFLRLRTFRLRPLWLPSPGLSLPRFPRPWHKKVSQVGL